MGIVELLKSDIPCYIQGSHTRLVCGGKGFSVLQKRTINGSYITSYYEGDDEEKAVEAFINSEDI